MTLRDDNSEKVVRRKDYENRIDDVLVEIMMQQDLTTQGLSDAREAIFVILEDYQKTLATTLSERIKALYETDTLEGWEKFIELGLRYALDVVNEVPSFEIKPIEEDYRDFKREFTYEDWKKWNAEQKPPFD